MKSLRNDKDVELALDLLQAIQMRKAAEKLEKELKTHFKGKIGDHTMLKVGNVVISLEDRSRSDIDKVLLEQDHGKDFIKKYSKTTIYKQMSVKLDAKAS